MIDFDKVLSRVGEFGPYQWVNVSILAALMIVMMPFPSYNYLFMLHVPQHWCVEAAGMNLTVNMTQNLTDQCSIPPNITGFTRNVKCTRWVYDTSEYVETAGTKFDLVCDKGYLTSMVISPIQQVSVAVGILFFSMIQDRLGRKPGLFIALAVSGIGGVCIVFSPNVWVFLIIRIVIASATLCGWTFPYVLAMEYVGPSKRTVVTMIMIITFASGAALLGVVAWFCHHWRTFGLVTAFSSLFFFVFYPVLDESPRWLLIRGKMTKLKKLVNKVGVSVALGITLSIP